MEEEDGNEPLQQLGNKTHQQLSEAGETQSEGSILK